jgi:uncharacterized membrane-anchored protein
MKKNRKNLLFLVVLLQALFFSTWFYIEKSKLSDPQSKTILVKTAPVDPRDFISGNYFTLNYEFSNSGGFKKRAVASIYQHNGKAVFAVLQKEGERFVPEYFTFNKPQIKSNQVAIKGMVEKNRFKFGIEKYFISENQKEPNSRKDKVEVMLIIDENLQARIKGLMVNGEEFK